MPLYARTKLVESVDIKIKYGIFQGYLFSPFEQIEHGIGRKYKRQKYHAFIDDLS
jgi:hypothetical protein